MRVPQKSWIHSCKSAQKSRSLKS